MSLLPIYDVRDELIEVLRAGVNVIIEAPTGSGKSTQVPQILLDSGVAADGRIVVLQPRRLAARMLARRVAFERGVKLGDEVGYQVRFDNCSSRSTRIKFETDGIVLRELQGDKLLRDVSVIVFDEFHERHLYSDIMLGLALELQATVRPDLKLVVMSATLETGILVDFFGECQVIRSEGRTFPVDICYLKPNARNDKLPVWDLATRELPELLRMQPNGDVLIFMPGAYEIRRTVDLIQCKGIASDCLVMPLYGNLSPADQDRAIEPASKRKIIVSTNVAETSLTIDGVCIVVDSGLVRRASYDHRRGINTLLIEKISQASATQRAGRAGRTAAGTCLRLWNERDHKNRDSQELPELLRIDLSSTLLQMKQVGVKDLIKFPWVNSPPADAVENAIDLLQNLGAFDIDGEITEMGCRMACFPLHPRISRMLIAAEHYGCVPTMCLIAALLQERGIILKNINKNIRERQLDLMAGQENSDIFLAVKVWEEAAQCNFRREVCDAIGVHGAAARAAEALQKQLEKAAESMGLDCFEVSPALENIYKCILIGFSDHVAVRSGTNRCALVGGRRGTISADTIIGSENRIFVAAEINEIGGSQGNVDVRLSGLTAIKQEWLVELFPEKINEKRRVYFDTLSRRMQAEQQFCYGDIVVESKRTGEVSDDEAASAMVAEVVAGRIAIKHWNLKVEQWISRVNLVAKYCPEMGVPAILEDDRKDIIEQICFGAHSVKAVKNSEVWPVLKNWLSSAQTEAVKAYAPERVTLENGRQPRLHYDDPSGPYVAMRIQELYDTHKTPLICNGNLRIKFKILAPNQRPAQITDDIESFWKNGYERVKKDLRGRYPKHEWR